MRLRLTVVLDCDDKKHALDFALAQSAVRRVLKDRGYETQSIQLHFVDPDGLALPDRTRLPEGAPAVSEPNEEPTEIEIGYKGGRVVLNVHGTGEVPQMFVAWSPDAAREVARQLFLNADCAEAS